MPEDVRRTGRGSACGGVRMNAPFFAADEPTWEEAAADFPMPWREAWARLDLRYHENRAGLAVRPFPFPGRVALAKRWGWTDRKVRDLIARDDWHDPHKKLTAKDLRPGWKGKVKAEEPDTQTEKSNGTSNSPPMVGPMGERTNAEKLAESANGTSNGPPMTCPHARLLSEPRSTTSTTPDLHAAPAVVPPLFAATPKPAPTRKPKPASPEAHPHHQAVFDAWCSTYLDVAGHQYGGGAEGKVHLSPAERGMLTRLRDDRVSRDPTKGARDVEALRDAFRRFMQRGPFVRPAGPSTVRAFCTDPAGWFSSTERATARSGRGHAFDSTAEALRLLDPDHEPARQQSGALDVTFTEVA